MVVSVISTSGSSVRPTMSKDRGADGEARSRRRPQASTGKSGTTLAAPARLRRDCREDRETDGGDAVVQQAFGFDDHRNARLAAHLAEGCDDRDRIGGGDQHAEQGRADPAPADQPMHSRGDHGSGDRNPEKGQRKRQRKLIAEAPPVELKRRLEHQRRKEDVEDQLARQRQVGAVGQQRDQEAGDRPARRCRAGRAAARASRSGRRRAAGCRSRRVKRWSCERPYQALSPKVCPAAPDAIPGPTCRCDDGALGTPASRGERHMRAFLIASVALRRGGRGGCRVPESSEPSGNARRRAERATGRPSSTVSSRRASRPIPASRYRRAATNMTARSPTCRSRDRCARSSG